MNLIPKRWQKDAPVQSSEPITSLQKTINDVFDNFWTGGWPSTMANLPEPFQASFNPKIETTEKDGTIEVSAELPGLSNDDINLTLSDDGDALILRGEKRIEDEKKEKDFYHAERAYGSFSRAVPLPARVDAEKTKARLENGVLRVTMHKAKNGAGPRQIKVG